MVWSWNLRQRCLLSTNDEFFILWTWSTKQWILSQPEMIIKDVRRNGKWSLYWTSVVPILYLLKTAENQRFSGPFMGYEIRTLARNGLLFKFQVHITYNSCHEEVVNFFTLLLKWLKFGWPSQWVASTWAKVVLFWYWNICKKIALRKKISSSYCNGLYFEKRY